MSSIPEEFRNVSTENELLNWWTRFSQRLFQELQRYWWLLKCILSDTIISNGRGICRKDVMETWKEKMWSKYALKVCQIQESQIEYIRHLMFLSKKCLFPIFLGAKNQSRIVDFCSRQVYSRRTKIYRPMNISSSDWFVFTWKYLTSNLLVSWLPWGQMLRLWRRKGRTKSHDRSPQLQCRSCSIWGSLTHGLWLGTSLGTQAREPE